MMLTEYLQRSMISTVLQISTGSATNETSNYWNPQSTATTSWRDSRVGSQVNCVINVTFDIRSAVGLYCLVMLSFHL